MASLWSVGNYISVHPLTSYSQKNQQNLVCMCMFVSNEFEPLSDRPVHHGCNADDEIS